MDTFRNETKVTAWLQGYLRQHEGIAGTVHVNRNDILELVAAVNIPEKVQEVTARIPRGKGMAGLCLERNRPVSTCNLQTDASGEVRPGARAVDAQAAVAIPVSDGAGGIRAVVGIAFFGERTLSEEELTNLSEAAQKLPETGAP